MCVPNCVCSFRGCCVHTRQRNTTYFLETQEWCNFKPSMIEYPSGITTPHGIRVLGWIIIQLRATAWRFIRNSRRPEKNGTWYRLFTLVCHTFAHDTSTGASVTCAPYIVFPYGRSRRFFRSSHFPIFKRMPEQHKALENIGWFLVQ